MKDFFNRVFDNFGFWLIETGAKILEGDVEYKTLHKSNVVSWIKIKL